MAAEAESRLELAGKLRQVVGNELAKNELMRQLASCAQQRCAELLLWYLEPDEAGNHRALALTCTEQAAMWETIAADVIKLLETRELAGNVVGRDCAQVAGKCVMAVTTALEPEQFEGFVAVVPCAQRGVAAGLLEELALARQFNAEMQARRRTEKQVESYRRIAQLMNIASSVSDVKEAEHAIVNFFREAYSLQSVALVSRNTLLKSCRVETVSDLESVDPTSELAQTLLALARTGWAADGARVFESDPTHAGGHEAHELFGLKGVQAGEDAHWERRFCFLTGSRAGMTVPLNTDGDHQLCMMLGAADASALKADAATIEASAESAANQLRLISKSDAGAISISMQWIYSLLRHNLTRTIAAAALAVGLLMLVPAPYVLKCDTQLQPSKRRFVAAPFESILQTTHVSDGDVVAADQLLATLDGRKLRMELAGLTADLQREQKRRNVALAENNVADSQIASLEVKRIESEMDICRRHLENLEIRAPIEGVILTGDLDEMEGAPLELGQTLFEIGPLEKMRVEVEIPEEEIRYVEPGQTVQVMFDAFPFESWEGSLQSIHTRSELRDDRCIFVGTVELENRRDWLRPGMQGRCRIRTHWYPIGWILFHRPLENVRGWLVW